MERDFPTFDEARGDRESGRRAARPHPSADLPDDLRTAQAGARENARIAAEGDETVLLVEDDEAVRVVIRRVLQNRGYTVLEAANGIEALEVCATTQHHIDLVFSDVVMPKMSGRVLLDRILAMPAHPKILMMSGYTEDEIERHGSFPPGTPFLEKPFTIAAVTRKVREVLDGAV